MLPSVQTRSGNRHHPFLQRQTVFKTETAALGRHGPLVRRFLPTDHSTTVLRPLPWAPAPERSLPSSRGPEASPQVRCTLPTEAQASHGHRHPGAQAPDQHVMGKAADPEKTLAGSQAPGASGTPGPSHISASGQI